MWASGGGITSSGSVLVMRLMASEAEGSPGTMAGFPDSPPLSACSRMSSRRPPFTAAASGPWQAKQVLERTGRTSRLKPRVSAAPSGTVRTQQRSKGEGFMETEPIRGELSHYVEKTKVFQRVGNRKLGISGKNSRGISPRANPNLRTGRSEEAAPLDFGGAGFVGRPPAGCSGRARFADHQLWVGGHPSLDRFPPTNK
jgi:hypothetical protein